MSVLSAASRRRVRFFVEPGGDPRERGVPIDGDFVDRVRLDVIDEALLGRAALEAGRLGIRVVDAGVGAAAQGARGRRWVLGVGLMRPEAVMRVLERLFAV